MYVVITVRDLLVKEIANLDIFNRLIYGYRLAVRTSEPLQPGLAYGEVISLGPRMDLSPAAYLPVIDLSPGSTPYPTISLS